LRENLLQLFTLMTVSF